MPPITCTCGECRTCKHRVYMRGWHERNRERSREHSRKTYAKYRYRFKPDPVKKRAGHIVYTEVRAGRLIPQPCEVCGAPKTDAHHDDYSKPLDVRWLCRIHHSREHML